jgi:amidase
MGRHASAVDLDRLTYAAGQATRRMVAFFDDVDVFLTPIVSSQPTRIGELAQHPDRALGVLDAIQFTAQYSVSGQPAVAVPSAVDGDGLPVGVQLVGRPADDGTLLCVAAQLEEASPWADRHPPGC